MLAPNRILSPRPLYKVSEWLGGTVLEDVLEVSAEQIRSRIVARVTVPGDVSERVLYPMQGLISEQRKREGTSAK